MKHIIMLAEQNINVISGRQNLNTAFNVQEAKLNWQKITSNLIRSCHCARPIYAYTQNKASFHPIHNKKERL